MRKQILLLEMYNLRMQLFENRMEFFKKNYLPRMAQYIQGGEIQQSILTRARITQQDTPEAAGMKMIEYVSSFDPDPAKKFTQWLLNILLKAGKDEQGQATRVARFEDLPGLKTLLTQYVAHYRQLPPEARDIMRFKTPGDLGEALQPFANTAAEPSKRDLERADEKKAYSESTVLFNDDQYRIVIPRTKFAAIFFGRNTRWCTAATTRNYFDDYNSRGALYVVLDKKNNRRWQFHFEDGQFMDEMDRSIDRNAFIAEHPTIAKFFTSHMNAGEKILEVNGCVVFKTPTSLIIRRAGDSGLAANFFASKAVATIQIQDGYLVSGDITYLFPESHRYNSSHSGRHQDYNKPTEFPIHISDGGDAVSDIMNQIKMPVRYEIQRQLADFAVFGTKDGSHFGQLIDAGEKILDVGKGRAWWELDCGNGRFFALYQGGHGHEITFACLNREGGDKAGEFQASEPDTKEENDALFQLLLHLKEVVALPRSKYYYNTDDLNQAQSAQIIDANPAMTDLLTLYKAFGPFNKRVQQELTSRLKECHFDGKLEFIENGSRLIMQRFKDAEEFVHERGNDYSQKVWGQVFGADYFDAYSEDTADESTRYDMLIALKKSDPALYKTFGEWLGESCSDAIERIKEDEDEDFEYDPTDMVSMIKVIQEEDDGSINDAFDNALRHGSETGARDDMYECFVKDLEGFKDLFFLVNKEAERPYQMELPFSLDSNTHIRYDKTFMHDVPVVIAPGVGDVIAALVDPEWEDHLGDSSDWLKYVEEWDESAEEDDHTFQHNEPYHGYSGYNKEAAEEKFSENVHDLVG